MTAQIPATDGEREAASIGRALHGKRRDVLTSRDAGTLGRREAFIHRVQAVLELRGVNGQRRVGRSASLGESSIGLLLSSDLPLRGGDVVVLFVHGRHLRTAVRWAPRHTRPAHSACPFAIGSERGKAASSALAAAAALRAPRVRAGVRRDRRRAASRESPATSSSVQFRFPCASALLSVARRARARLVRPSRFRPLTRCVTPRPRLGVPPEIRKAPRGPRRAARRSHACGRCRHRRGPSRRPPVDSIDRSLA